MIKKNIRDNSKNKYIYEKLNNNTQIIYITSPNVEYIYFSFAVNVGSSIDLCLNNKLNNNKSNNNLNNNMTIDDTFDYNNDDFKNKCAYNIDGCGLAHFLEHSIYLGSKNYPEVGLLKKEIKLNDGYSNAMTSKFQTVYYFCIKQNEEGFNKILDIFVDSLMHPLLEMDVIINEVNQIESEYNNRKKEDFLYIYYQLSKFSFNNINNFNAFTCGNHTTLNRENIEKIRILHEYFYTGNNITVCILYNEKLVNIKNTLRQQLSKIKKEKSNFIYKQNQNNFPLKSNIICFYKPVVFTNKLLLY